MFHAVVFGFVIWRLLFFFFC